jgi:glycosyltransferase involved in cell wall biosynthesis
MRICIIGKFPPIEGGVSTRTYWTAHGLAERGHEVHVVTNAKEVGAPFRMHMRHADWQRCEAGYGRGSVSVHWTDPVDRSQSYIPMASPFVTKLAALAAEAHAQLPFDVILSHYLEPYGVAAHLAAEITGAPHIARTAGSDAGRLWRHPQFARLYDHVLRSAEIVIAAGAVAERAVAHGVDAARIAFGGTYIVPQDVFTPEGPSLEVAEFCAEAGQDPELRDQLWGELPAGMVCLGVYGKLGESKGSFALLSALQRLKAERLDVGLLAMAHGRPAVERRFRACVRRLGLEDRVLQIPFLPNWRVPEFLRGCLAVCVLEQDFPIALHSPVLAREVLLTGSCLVASAEMVRKLPAHARLPDGYGCVAIANVNDVDELSRRLAAILRDPSPVAAVGARGCSFARDLQQELRFLEPLERLCEAAAIRQRPAATPRPSEAETIEERFSLTRTAEAAVGAACSWQALDIPKARSVLAAVEQAIAAGRHELGPLAAAVRLEIDIAVAEDAPTEIEEKEDPLFRLRLRRWAIGDDDLLRLLVSRGRGLRIVRCEYDARQFQGIGDAAQLPLAAASGPSYIAAFARPPGRRRSPLLVDADTARVLKLADGTRTVAEIINDTGSAISPDALPWIEALFQLDLLRLSGAPPVLR